ncbi:hypothetical protein F5B22DRAFT_643677 [Xylaria bambusicola]|uniref:uncharacterized protein n=1 Tax=Xylaria bambusicola TaxID=326684 RepID=UPI002008368F|nr:uncharacterized protein F5B22DRAFT_643677 [Xylaria bambusicola]KAI0521511.1 hypothetical protein F5B22DRAFT_643677 [Xylaria bambusicola]
MVSLKSLTLALALAVPMVSAMPAEDHHHSKHQGHQSSMSHHSSTSHHTSHHSSLHSSLHSGHDDSNTSKFGSKLTHSSHSTKKPSITTSSGYFSVSIRPSLDDIVSLPLTTSHGLGATPTIQTEGVEETPEPASRELESPIIIPTGVSIKKGGSAVDVRRGSPISPPNSGWNSGSSSSGVSGREYTNGGIRIADTTKETHDDVIYPLGGGLFHPSWPSKANSMSANVVPATAVMLLLVYALF